MLRTGCRQFFLQQKQLCTVCVISTSSPAAGAESNILLFLNMSRFSLWFLSFVATVVFQESESQSEFERQWFWRRWDAANLRVHCQNCRCQTLGTLNYWIFQLHGRQLSFFLHVPASSLSESLESHQTRRAETPHYILKGFFFFYRCELCFGMEESAPFQVVIWMLSLSW